MKNSLYLLFTVTLFVLGCTEKNNPVTNDSEEVYDTTCFMSYVIKYSVNGSSPSVIIDTLYKTKGQEPRPWDRIILYSDMDSVTVARWDSLTVSEKLKAIRSSFTFNLTDSIWESETDEMNLKMLLDNADIQWE
jgi:hypothetical protein